VVIPTLNEANRLEPCLRGLSRQDTPVSEIIVVDSGSTDGTRELVEAASRGDARLRLVSDPPLPPDWIGKVWALQHGLSVARGEWILNMDADTEANEGAVAAIVGAALTHQLDLVSFAPRFAGQTAAERWLQPALLVTLVFRFGAPGPTPRPGQLLANGQCFLVRRDTLLGHGGYAAARTSFADDVMLARWYAERGVRCGFLDGSRLYRVRAYRSAREMWREWGRSVDLSDTVSRRRRWMDLLFLTLVQGMPLPLTGLAAAGLLGPSFVPLLWINPFLVVIRLLVMKELAGSYERRGMAWWLSFLADPVAIVRIVLSMIRRPVEWRGRTYRQST
jgi:dolichol-phosphate mannosyltransferase